MTGPAPSVDVATLVHRLASCPDDVTAPPRLAQRGVVSVPAVLGDVLRDLGAEIDDAWIEATAAVHPTHETERWLRGVLIACWLVRDPALDGVVSPQAFLTLLSRDLRAVVDLVGADVLVRDPDRREELARLLLRAAGVTPAGETPERAADRLATLDSVTRTRVEAEARAAEQRARDVREALARQRAAEAAARVSRE